MMEFEQLLPQGLESDLPPDLDLIEVLWRQDVDLGAGKEVFDPNLRRELEHEREIELHKEQEKRKLAEKREREQQQLNEQWLSENFTRDGETGELIPIAGNGTTNANYSSSGPSSYYPETGAQAQASAYNFDGSNHSSQVNHTYGQPIHHQQDAVAPLLPDSLLFLDSQADEPQLANLTQEEELPSEEDWAELVGYLDSALNQTTSVINTTSTTTIVNTNIIMPPVESQAVIVPATITTTTTTNNMNEPQLYYNHQYQQQQQQQQQYDNLFNFDQTPTLSSSASMNETLHLLRQNSTGSSSSILAGLLNQTEPALVHNVTLPLAVGLDNAPHPLTGLVEPLSDDQDAMPQDLNSTLAGTDGGDMSSGDFQDIFPNLMELANLTNNMDPSDILSGLSEEDMAGLASAGLENIQLPDDAGSDSAISMGSASPNQDVNETMDISPFDGLEGATGGSDFDATDYGNQRTHSYSSGGAEDDGYHYSCSSYGSPASVNTNYSTGSNDTEHSSSLSSTSLGHVHHNHTYNTLPGHTPREVKKYAKRDGPRMKGPQSRDTKRAESLKIPFTVERIIHAPVEEFNDMMTKFKLTDAQANLMRDIRRRGKNKVAAQNCRKRKLDVIVDLSDDLSGMQRARDKLAAERRRVEEERRQAKEHYNKLYKAIFSSLRDEQGRPYDPDQYSLQHSADGNVFLVHLSNLTAAAPVPMPISSGSGAGPSRRSGKRKEGGGVQSHKKKNKE